MISLTRQQVLAFRQHQQFLSPRAAPGEILQVTALGIQNTPPDSALLAIGARLDRFSREEFDLALETRKSLLQIWSLRSAPYISPVADYPVFTTGISPTTEAECLFLMRGAADHLRRFGLTATWAVELTAGALQTVFAPGTPLTKDELGVRLAGQVRQYLPASLQEAWDEPDGMRTNTFGQSIVRYALSVVSLSGILCSVPLPGVRAAGYMLTDSWLGYPPSSMDIMKARAELVRRFAHYYGPCDRNGFTHWAGVSPEYVRHSWSLISAELIPVMVNHHKKWIPAADLDFIQNAQPAVGVHLLPPHDPYLSAPDKDLLVPEDSLRRQIWRVVGSPGAVLNNGEIVGIWRPNKRGRALSIEISLFSPENDLDRASVEQAAQRMASLRKSSLASIRYL